MTVVLDVGGGPVPVVLERLPVIDGDGLWLGRCPWSDLEEQWPGFPAFVETGPADLLGVALVVGGMRDVEAVAMAPASVPVSRTALALAVAQRLCAVRVAAGSSPVPVVTCGVRPPVRLGSGVVAVPHEVTVTVGGGVQVRVVWEVLRAKRLAEWLAALRPVAAPSVAVAA